MIEFNYKGKIYNTENLDKKLKRLKITKDDITIIREYDNIKQETKDEYNDWYHCYFYNTKTNNFYITISKDKTKPDNSIFYKDIWNTITKTGIKEFTKEFIDNLILLDGKPIFPIIIDEKTKLPKLEYNYEWR